MGLTSDQIERGFWYQRPQQSFPPPAIERPAQYQGAERLAIACTQLDISPYQQKKLVSHWCAVLPELSSVRILWFQSRVNQALFEAACAMPRLEGLYMKWSGIRSLEPLTQLPCVKYLHVGSSAQVESIECLAVLHALVVLEVENFKKIQHLAPIGALTQLEGLSVEGDIWTTQRVESLRPLSHLKALRYLHLANLRSEDRSLRPLTQLKSLRKLRLAKWWSAKEIQALGRALPSLRVD